MTKLPKHELAKKERLLPHGADKCKCGHTKNQHLGGKYTCDHCMCEDFIDTNAVQESAYEEYERS